MSKNHRSLGPSNDKIPKRELVAAELIAVAQSHGLRASRGALFRDKSHRVVVEYTNDVVSCCAAGAAQLGKVKLGKLSNGLIVGNDGWCFSDPDESDGYDVGWTFYNVCKKL